MTVKVLIDECLPYSLKVVFENHGINAVHNRDLSLLAATDEIVFKNAQEQNRILVTKDKGFGNIRDYPIGTHCGIIVFYLPKTTAATDIKLEFDKFLSEHAVETFKNALVIYDNGKIRIRRK